MHVAPQYASFFVFHGFLHLFLYHDVNFMLGESFLFLEMFSFLLFCLFDQCLQSSALVRGMSAHAMVLAKLFSCVLFLCILVFGTVKSKSFPFLGPFLGFFSYFLREHLVGLIFLNFQSLSRRTLPQNGQDHLGSCIPILSFSFSSYLAQHGKEFP